MLLEHRVAFDLIIIFCHGWAADLKTAERLPVPGQRLATVISDFHFHAERRIALLHLHVEARLAGERCIFGFHEYKDASPEACVRGAFFYKNIRGLAVRLSTSLFGRKRDVDFRNRLALGVF